jgi:hypothetical protein
VPDILAIIGPIFLLIGLGFLAVRTGLYAQTALPALGSLVITFCLPALLFRSLSQRSGSDVANGRFLLAYAAGSLVAFGVGLLWARRAGQPRDAAAMTGMGMSCSNSAFVGFPVALQLLGPEASVALALIMLVENFLMIPLSLALADSASQDHLPVHRAMARAMWGLRKNPIVLGIVAGLGAGLVQLHLPSPALRAVDLLANASAAVSLFFIGGTLVGKQVGNMLGQVAAVAVGKLLVHPAATLAAVLLVGPMAPHLQWAAVVMAAAPMLGIYPILGQKYGRQAVNAACMLVATVASFASLALVIGLLQASNVLGPLSR